MYWAYKQGKAGVPLYDRTAINIGSCVHQMAELDLVDRPDSEILEYAHGFLARQDDLAKAITCFNQYRAWRERNHVRPIDIENPLVSEDITSGCAHKASSPGQRSVDADMKSRPLQTRFFGRRWWQS
jgi:hypothetical protein